MGRVCLFFVSDYQAVSQSRCPFCIPQAVNESSCGSTSLSALFFPVFRFWLSDRYVMVFCLICVFLVTWCRTHFIWIFVIFVSLVKCCFRSLVYFLSFKNVEKFFNQSFLWSVFCKHFLIVYDFLLLWKSIRARGRDRKRCLILRFILWLATAARSGLGGSQEPESPTWVLRPINCCLPWCVSRKVAFNAD